MRKRERDWRRKGMKNKNKKLIFLGILYGKDVYVDCENMSEKEIDKLKKKIEKWIEEMNKNYS